MTSRLRRTLFLLCLLAIVGAGCSSSSDADVETAGSESDEPTATAVVENPDDDEPESDDAEPDDAESTATSIPLPPDDAAVDEAIAGLDGAVTADPDPETLIQGFVRSRFNIDPDPDQIQCITGEAEGDEDLTSAINNPDVLVGQISDVNLRVLATAMNGCLATLSLADWATQAIGPQGDVRDTAPPCFVERFDAQDGDVTFYNFAALTFQNRLEPTGIDGLVDALSTCAPITSLSDFFAISAEQSTNFSMVVDRNCLNEALSPPEVTREFWETFVEGLTPPTAVITPHADGCSEDPTAGFDLDVPADFEPWSGTGALSTVLPAARNSVYTAPPPMTIDASATYQAVIATGDGEIRIDLFADTAPLTVNSFVSLARDGFYDGTVFHRVLPDFMAQGGDPTATGAGGPGYQFADEFDGGRAIDDKGVLAMANSGPDTNGSQFFITFVPVDRLTGLHTVFGQVVEGLDVLDAIDLRDPDAPTSRGQLIESITIEES